VRAKSGETSEYPRDLGKLELVCVNCGAVITANDIDKCPHCGQEPFVEIVVGLIVVWSIRLPWSLK